MPNIPTSFPPFDLTRLLKTVFDPEGGEQVCVLIDLDDPTQIKDHAYISDPANTIQKYAHDVFHKGLQNGTGSALNLKGGEMFAYKKTGGSNLDLPDECYDVNGIQLSLEKDVYLKYDIILCVSTFSATAPLTAQAKKVGFRGATLHGLNEIILNSGLAVDYNEVSATAEKMRLGITNADWVEIDFEVKGASRHTLRLICNGQDAQKSHGLCRGNEPDVANLPAGEIYYVPEGAEGEFPMRYEDGTIAIMKVKEGRIFDMELVRGDAEVVAAHRAKIASDPVTGEIGELGMGTQLLPVSGRDIQDEKVLGTVHVATGRSDHLGGHLTPDLFNEKMNATHDDILFSPSKTPEITVTEVRMQKNGETIVLIEHYEPSDYVLELRGEAVVA